MRNLLFAAALVCASNTAFAADGAGSDLNDDAFLRGALEAQKGKVVTLRLLAGEEVSGKVADVGDAAVRLTELTGKEFYEALVRTDNISALIVRSAPATK